jgi:hypothetical protein
VFFKGIPSSNAGVPGIYTFFAEMPDGTKKELPENDVIQLSNL